MATGFVVTHPSADRIVLTLAILFVLLAVGVRTPRKQLFLLVPWLVGLGLVRRLMTLVSPTGVDPLLLIGPLVFGFLLIAASREGAFRSLSTLSKAVAVLSAFVVAGSLNPLQGGPQTGLAGLLFMFVPMAAFWIGRGLCDDAALKTVFKLVAWLAVLAAAYGLVQTSWGFPSWDQLWIRSSGFISLNVGGTYRAFGSFSSAQEYALFLSVGLLAWLFIGPKRFGLIVTLAAIPLVAIAVFLASSRSVVIFFFGALGIGLSARLRMPFFVSGILASVFLVVLVVSASQLGLTNPAVGRGSTLLSHQVDGLANPFDSRQSTLGIHASRVGTGIQSAVSHPLGLGTGSVSRAASKFGATNSNTEIDPSNVAVALGIPGLLAFLALLVVGLPKAYRLASGRKDMLPTLALCVLIATLFQWLNGGLYSVAFLPWLILGWIDRQSQAQARALADDRSQLSTSAQS